MSSTARALHIFIPEPQSTFFSLYAHCALAGKSYHSERNGTFLLTKGGAVILFYTFTHHHRRAYIVCPWLTLSPDVPPTKLLGVTEPVAVLYHAQGRRIDFLRRALWYIQQETGKAHMHFLPPQFWLQFGCLNDVYHASYKLPGTTRTNVSLLLHRYKDCCHDKCLC